MSHCSGFPSIQTLRACPLPYIQGVHAVARQRHFYNDLECYWSQPFLMTPRAPCAAFSLAGNDGVTSLVQLHHWILDVHCTCNVNSTPRLFHLLTLANNISCAGVWGYENKSTQHTNCRPTSTPAQLPRCASDPTSWCGPLQPNKRLLYLQIGHCMYR